MTGWIGGGRLTEGEEEGIEANEAARWNLGDEPLGHVHDGHWRKSHMTDWNHYWLWRKGQNKSSGLPAENIDIDHSDIQKFSQLEMY